MKAKKLAKSKPSFAIENTIWKNNVEYIAGVDEVGRGAFAGPLIAAAVIFPKDFNPNFLINDSKQISPQKRLDLSKKIKEISVNYAFGVVNVSFINRYGIAKANQKAFYQAIKNLKNKPDHILTDFFSIKEIKNISQDALKHGDKLSITIAAASIIAKVKRDAIMVNLHKKHPQYGFSQNKGYGTKCHKDAISKNGLCMYHRTIFKIGKYCPNNTSKDK